MNKARERFEGLLAEVSLSPTKHVHGQWLLKLFNRLQPDYTPGKCLGGHDMNTHVLFMVILAVRMHQMLGGKLGCSIENLIAAALLHEIDHVLEYKTERNLDPDGSLFRANVNQRLRTELSDCPFEAAIIEEIKTAVENHSGRYDESQGTQLQRRLQQLDMISRFNPMCLMVAAAHHGSYAEFLDMDKPWLLDRDPETRFGKKGHSLYTILLGDVLVWYTWLPEDIRPLANEYLPGYLAAVRSLGPLIAQITGGENLAENDIEAVLGSFYLNFQK